MNLGNTGPLYLNSVLFFTAAPSVVDASLCYTDALFRNEGLTPPLPGGLPAGSPRLWPLRDGISWREPPWPSGRQPVSNDWSTKGHKNPRPSSHTSQPWRASPASQLPTGLVEAFVEAALQPSSPFCLTLLSLPLLCVDPKITTYHLTNFLYTYYRPQSLLSREPTCNTLLLGLLFFLVKYIFSKQSINGKLLGFPFLKKKKSIFPPYFEW